MQINGEESALLSLENMELKLSMAWSPIMPTRRAGARTRAQVPCELPATCSDPARKRGLAALKATPKEGHPPLSEDQTTQDLSISAKLVMKAFRAGSC